MHGIVCNSGCLDYNEIASILPKDEKGQFFAKETENYKVFGKFLDQEVENLDDRCCPKFPDLLEEEIRTCLFYQFRRKTTLHCAEGKAEFAL